MAKQKIIIIGGGIAGCATALALAKELPKEDYEIILVERNAKLLHGSSNNTPCRLGLGFHYNDLETAKKYLHATIGVVKQYPGYRVAEKQPDDHPYRRGRYFIVKDSIFKKDKIYPVFEKLKEEYRRLVDEDKTNKVFGEPDDFYRELRDDEIRNSGVNPEIVEAGIETAEQILNWPKLQEDLIKEVESHENITVIKNVEVSNVKTNHDTQSFTVEGKNLSKSGKPVERYESDYVINSSWENIEWINYKAGLGIPPKPRTNRTKVMIEVNLPEELKDKNSMFFCFGSHCSFSNTGDDKAYITAEKITNIEANNDLRLSELSERLISGDVKPEAKEAYAANIISEVAKYIPAMSKATFTGNIKFGIVKTAGIKDIQAIKEQDSAIHQRRESGVVEQQLGWIDNASMKLLYFLKNAKEVMALLKQQIQAKKELDKSFKKHFENEADSVKAKVLTPVLTNYFWRNTTATELSKLKEAAFNSDVHRMLDNKKALMQSVRQQSSKQNSVATSVFSSPSRFFAALSSCFCGSAWGARDMKNQPAKATTSHLRYRAY